MNKMVSYGRKGMREEIVAIGGWQTLEKLKNC
jgi:hypothetical protein